jgi:hypothetical protein
MVRKLDVHDTPRPGRGLKRAAIAWAVVSTPGQAPRFGAQATGRRAIAAWAQDRKAAKAHVPWQFTTAKARQKRKRLYP